MKKKRIYNIAAGCLAAACAIGACPVMQNTYAEEPTGGVQELKKVLLGDVDEDNKITLQDVQKELKMALKIMNKDESRTVYLDLDGDGDIDLKDAQKLLKKALKIEKQNTYYYEDVKPQMLYQGIVDNGFDGVYDGDRGLWLLYTYGQTDIANEITKSRQENKELWEGKTLYVIGTETAATSEDDVTAGSISCKESSGQFLYGLDEKAAVKDGKKRYYIQIMLVDENVKHNDDKGPYRIWNWDQNVDKHTQADVELYKQTTRVPKEDEIVFDNYTEYMKYLTERKASPMEGVDEAFFEDHVLLCKETVALAGRFKGDVIDEVQTEVSGDSLLVHINCAERNRRIDVGEGYTIFQIKLPKEMIEGKKISADVTRKGIHYEEAPQVEVMLLDDLDKDIVTGEAASGQACKVLSEENFLSDDHIAALQKHLKDFDFDKYDLWVVLDKQRLYDRGTESIVPGQVSMREDRYELNFKYVFESDLDILDECYVLWLIPHKKELNRDMENVQNNSFGTEIYLDYVHTDNNFYSYYSNYSTKYMVLAKYPAQEEE